MAFHLMVRRVAECRARLAGAFPLRNLVAALLASLLLFAGGCSSVPEQDVVDSGPLVWPAPPDQPRYEHRAVIYSSADVMPETDEQRMKRLFAGTERPKATFVKAFDVAASGGRVYVTDTGIDQVHVFDLARQRYFRMGYRLEGTLQQPLGVTIGPGGEVYVVDRKRAQVVVFDAYGLYQREIGTPEQLSRPTAVAVAPDGSRIYVVNTGSVEDRLHQVVVYSAKGELLFRIGQRGSGEGEFNLPLDATTDARGNLYVLDSGNFRVQVFDPEGNFLHSWGKLGKGFGQFARPRGIAIDREGLVYVSDTEFGNIQVFSPDGRLLLPVGERGLQDKRGHFALLAGIAVDETGHLFAVDQRHKKLEVIRKLDDVQGKRLLQELLSQPAGARAENITGMPREIP